MKVARLETLYCDAGWRPWIFLKATTADGGVGWAEITDSHGSPRGLAGIVEDLAPIVVGRDPRAVEGIVWDLFRATRQSPGSVIQKAIGGIENALLDLKAKALGVPVYELFGGPTRETVDVYWSHCGTTRARAWEVTNTPKLASYDDVTALGKEVVDRGFKAFKTNIVVPGDDPQVLMPGFQGEGLERNPSPELEAALVRLLDAFRQGTGGKAEPIVDLNFNLTAEGVLRISRALAQQGLMWLEVDAFDPVSLAAIRANGAVPICSGENLYTNRGFRPFFEAGAMDVASVDVIWNGFHQAKKIADLAETFEVNCAPHNYYSHLATFISAQWCAAIPNVRILEVDVDDVPWREELTTAVPEISGGVLTIPTGPGLGSRRQRGRAAGASVELTMIPREEFERAHDDLALLADMCRVNALVAVKRAGSGHLGSSFSAMDVVVHLFYRELNTVEVGFDDPERDIYFSSKGHDVPGQYAVLYALGVLPAEKLLKLRRLGGLDGHPDVGVPGIEANSGSLGMGISKGRGMAWAKRFLDRGGRVVVMTGDGELQEGQNFEGLQAAAAHAQGNLWVIVDRNELQSDKPTDEILALGDLESKLRAFGWQVTSCDGHDHDELSSAFAELRSGGDVPKVLVANTIKGKGVSFMEHPRALAEGGGTYRWHAGAPDDESFARAHAELVGRIRARLPDLRLRRSKVSISRVRASRSPVSRRARSVVTSTSPLPTAMRCSSSPKSIPELVVLDADLASDCRIRPFELAHPERFHESGIAEQDMVSAAAGMARQGLLPVVNSFASFLASRANEQIYNQASERTKVDLCAPLRRPDTRRAREVAPEHSRRLAACSSAEHGRRAAGKLGGSTRPPALGRRGGD